MVEVSVGAAGPKAVAMATSRVSAARKVRVEGAMGVSAVRKTGGEIVGAGSAERDVEF